VAGRRDKLAAYQTLHAVLRELCRLGAPVVPFITEVMWKNLNKAHPLPRVGLAESVHLCDYPQADAALIDDVLSQDMEAVMRIVSLGMSARNKAGINVRQPLAELLVKPTLHTDRN